MKDHILSVRMTIQWDSYTEMKHFRRMSNARKFYSNWIMGDKREPMVVLVNSYGDDVTHLLHV